MMDVEAIKAQAEKEVYEELFRSAVNARKEWLLKNPKRPLWRKFFPWKFYRYDERAYIGEKAIEEFRSKVYWDAYECGRLTAIKADKPKLFKNHCAEISEKLSEKLAERDRAIKKHLRIAGHGSNYYLNYLSAGLREGQTIINIGD